MPPRVSASQRVDLEAAAADLHVRRWKRYRAVLLRREGTTVAQTMGCGEASIYAWTAPWRQVGVDGPATGDRGGGHVKLGRRVKQGGPAPPLRSPVFQTSL